MRRSATPRSELQAHCLLIALPLMIHLPALAGWYLFDPIYLVSGLTEGTWQGNGLLHGYPWLDPNAGVTTEALGALAARDWLHGILPWWNPFNGVGMPLAAEGQTPAFFLPFVLLLALPHGLLALRIAMMALAGCFTFALLRRLRLGAMPALAGAVLFQSNGTFAWFAHGPILPIAFLPLMLLGLEKALGGGFPVATVAGVAWSFLAGFPETAVLNLGFAAIWGGLRTVQSPRPVAYAARCGAAVLAGLLIAAPAMWPFLEALPRSFVGRHAAGLGGGLWPANLALALFPAVLGNPLSAPDAPAWVGFIWWRAGGYVPVAVLALALAALRRHGPEVALRWTLAGFVALTAARAAAMPAALALFGLVPLLRQAAVHMYVWPAWSLAASVLAGLALQDWREGRRPGVVVAAVAAACMSCIALWLAMPAVGWMLRAPPPFYHPLRSVFVGVAVAVAALGLMREPATRWREWLLVCAVCGQSAALAVFWLLAGPHGRTLDAAAVHFLQTHAGLARVVSFGPLVPNYGAMFGVAQVGYNALPAPADWVLVARTRLQPGFDGINLYEGALPTAARLRAAIPAYEAMGAAYALTWPGDDLTARFAGARLAYGDTVMKLWALPAPAPYAEATGCTVRAPARLRMEAVCGKPSRLLRRELFAPGWAATVNGAPAPVRRADIFQAVDVPAGPSSIVFTYAPPWIGAAWAACAAGILLLIGATWRPWRTARPPAH